MKEGILETLRVSKMFPTFFNLKANEAIDAPITFDEIKYTLLGF